MNISETAEEGDGDEVHLIVSLASLLSGRGFTDCQNAQDPTCSGGVAAVAAWSRHYAKEYNATATLVAPIFDYQHPFTQQHPLGWDVNRLVFQELLGWKLFLARLWLLESDDTGRSVEGLQSKDLPLLISNSILNPLDAWARFVEQIHFDEESSIVLMHLVENLDNANLYTESLGTALSLLDYIRRVNQQSGCLPNTDRYDAYVNRTSSTVQARCWIPVVLSDLTRYQEDLLDGLLSHESPPALFVDYNGIDPTLNSGEPVQLTNGESTMWALSYRSSSAVFPLIRLTKKKNQPTLSNVVFDLQQLRDFPDGAKDEKYASDILQLRQWADETIANDPVIGQSTEFLVAKTPDNLFVRCEAGECEHGNLFTDAMRWATNADFAFENGAAYHGLGWPAGDVKVSNLWETIPFANNICEGYMTGLNLWKMANYSVSTSTFSYANTIEGGNLQQVSGLKLTYNTQLEASKGKLVKLEIWNATKSAYVPVERLKIYKFATNSYNCCCNAPFNAMATTNLNIPGEIPGRTLPLLEQEAVANFLSQLNGPYSSALQGRLTNDTTALANLDLSQSQELCLEGIQYWSSSYQTCFDCPNIDNIVSVWDRSEPLIGASGQLDEVILRASIVNEEDFGVALALESIPSFLSCSSPNGLSTEVSRFCSGLDTFRVEAGGQLHLDFAASFKDLQAGLVQAVVVIDVTDSGNFPGCRGVGLNLDVELQVLPTEELNQLGHIRIVGYCLAGLIMSTAVGFAFWCLINRQSRSVKLMQPLFLVTLCVGIFVGGSAIIPMSIDDEIVSEENADIACVAYVWLISFGFSISFSALYAKLRRVNKIVSNAANFRRIQVRERDVLGPMALLVVANLAVLLTWSFLDPVRFERDSVEGQPWNTYGQCRSNRNEGDIMLWLLFGINALALATACWEAYKARNVSKELSEASRIGMAIFSWLQLALIGFPVILLLDQANTVVSYFVRICLVFFSAMSLLLWVFVPLVIKEEEEEDALTGSTRRTVSRINHVGTVSRISTGEQALNIPSSRNP